MAQNPSAMSFTNYRYVPDAQSQVADEESDDDKHFKYNRHKNQHSEFYESLKEQHRQESIERLPLISDVSTIDSPDPKSQFITPKHETAKMRKLSEQRTRS